MKLFFPHLKKFGDLFLSKATLARRALLRMEASEQKANEAERLDRLRNPSNYRGK
jgi:hypothetical protein